MEPEQEKREIRSLGGKVVFGMVCGAICAAVALSGGYYYGPGTLRSNKKLEEVNKETAHNDSINTLKDTIIKHQSIQYLDLKGDFDKAMFENKQMKLSIREYARMAWKVSKPRRATAKDSIDLDSWIIEHNTQLR